MNGEEDRQFKMLGFADESSVPRHHFVAGVDVVLPMKGSRNERAFAALVVEMIDTKKVLMAKLIERKNTDAKLVALFPAVQKAQSVLYLVQLPTAEELRDYQFPSLVASTNVQRSAVSNFIDSLDLCEDQVEPEMTFNPSLQYFGQVLTDKIAHQERNKKYEMPPMKAAILEYCRPDRQMFTEAKEEIEAFDTVF